MCWIGIWSMIMHWILAFTNSCNALTFVTRFSCDIFGFYVAFIYLQKGIQVLTRQWGEAGGESAFLSVTVALLVLGFAYGCAVVGESNLFQRHVRKFIEDYGTPLTIIFFTGFVRYGHMKDVEVETLPVSRAFFPTTDRSWFVHFWDISAGDIFLAIPFALLLTILFWFDHNGVFHPRITMLRGDELTSSSILPYRPRDRIPFTQTTRISLGHLSPRPHDIHCRYPRYTLSQWSHPSSSLPH
jgi:boron transporter